MYKKRITRLTSVILALLMLVSCAPKNTEGASSIYSDNETHNAVISDEQAKTETNEKEEIKENEADLGNQPEKEETTSRLPVERPDGTKQEAPVSSEESTSSEETSSGAVKLPYVMPKDNPEPISIHRADAATPTPFSYTDSIVGEEMSFNVNKSAVSSPHWDRNNRAAVIKTYDELKSLQSLERLEEHHFSNKGDYYTDHYDESFFKDKALVILLVDGQIHEYDVPKVVKNNDQMCIYRRTIRISKSAAASQTRTLIEVSKDDLASVKTLVIYYETRGSI